MEGGGNEHFNVHEITYKIKKKKLNLLPTDPNFFFAMLVETQN